MDGILLFNKPILWTSHDAVDFIRRRIGQRSVGHAGTLDPMAVGLLVMLVGKATKLFETLSASDKDYSGTMTLGMATDTQDLEGRILSTLEYDRVEEKEVLGIFSQMCGTQTQIPPSFSAVKQNGKKMYSLARRGIAVQPKAKEVTISKFCILNFSLPDIHFFMTCSKGTYVRSICEVVGQKLGVGAVLSSLVRTRVGPFTLDKALGEDQVRELTPQQIEARLVVHHENL